MSIDHHCPHCGVRELPVDLRSVQAGLCGKCGQPLQSASLPAAADGTSSQRLRDSGWGRWARWATSRVGVNRLTACVAVLLLVTLLVFAFNRAHDTTRRVTCNSHFKQIGLALFNYEQEHGAFPPLYVADANGRPLHSWRVLILPQLVGHELYAQIDLSQPWDAPVNRAVAGKMPEVYGCPSMPPGSSLTNYVGSNGPGGFFDGAHARKLSEITDGQTNTLMVLELPDARVHWMDPTDGQGTHPPIPVKSPHRHPRGFNAGFADGSVRLLAYDIDPQTIEAMRTIDGGEAVHYSSPPW